jgi:hypothetical protein
MITLLLALLSLQVSAVSIYGIDNRSEAAMHADKSALVDSSAALIKEKYLLKTPQGFSLKAPTAKNEFLLCEGEAFEQQMSASQCSGTLIAPDLIYTAGHCYRDEKVCQEAVWVFDYLLGKSIEEKNIYRCGQVFKTSDDFSIIKLDRPVNDRLPVEISDEDLEYGDDIFMIGTMLGLPLKVTDEARILSEENERYITNLDAFVGNSGSGVYDLMSKRLSGILISGETDFVFQQGCYRSRIAPEKLGQEIVLGVSSLRRWLESYSKEASSPQEQQVPLFPL